MVRKIFGFLYRETDKLHQAALLLAIFSVLSQLLAFVRDRLLAHIFGASLDLDIYYAAFRIPDLIFVTVASIVSLSVLVPFIVDKEGGGREAVRGFVDDVFSFFSILIVLVCGVAFIFMPSLSEVLFKGFEAGALEKVVALSRILLLSPILLGLSNLFGSLTQAYNRFLVYAFAPVLYNVGIIFGIAALSSSIGIRGIAYGVVLGSLMHVAIQIPFVSRLGLMPRLKMFDFSNIWKIVSISLPRTLTLSMSHLATIFLVALASLMTAGSISVFTFAQNISSVPLSIIGVSYSLAAFPTLSRHFADNNLKAFVDYMSTTIRHIIFWALPLVALFVVLRAQIVRVLLGTGNFDWSDTRLTAAALAIFALSALSQCLLLLFIRSFYSAGHTRKPLVINLFSTVILAVCAYGAVKLYYSWPTWGYFISSLLRVEDISGTVVLMLPLGFTIGTIINSVLHWVSFEKDFGRFPKEIYQTLFVSISVSVFVGLGSYVGLNLFDPMFDSETVWEVFLHGLLSGILGIAIGVLVLWLLKSKELQELRVVSHKKFEGVDPVAENAEIV